MNDTDPGNQPTGKRAQVGGTSQEQANAAALDMLAQALHDMAKQGTGVTALTQAIDDMRDQMGAAVKQRAASGPSEKQLLLELQFLALRNAFGSRGQAAPEGVALLPPPTWSSNGDLTFVAGSLKGAETITLTYADASTQDYSINVVRKDKLTNTGKTPPVMVKIVDKSGTTLRLGAPLRS